MSHELLIRRVRLVGDEIWEWRFERGVNIIVGPIGVGKTTLLNLIRFGLGGSWTPTKKARESAHTVVLDLVAGAHEVTITRPFKGGRVTVAVDGDMGRPIPLRATANRPETLSSHLLELLGIPRVKVPTSRAKPGKRKTSVSFPDVLTHLYLEQTEIDRSIAHSGDRNRENKRLYVFELLYGLLDAPLAELQTSIGAHSDRRSELIQERDTVEKWAERLKVTFDSAVSAERAAVEVEAADRELAAERVAHERLLAEMPDLREREAVALEQLEAAANRLNETQLERTRTREVAAQLQLDIERMHRGRDATSTFQAFDYVSCPRCLQDLDIEHPAGHCGLCGQHDVQPPSVVAIKDEAERRAEQLRDSEGLLRVLDREEEKIRDELREFEQIRAAAREASADSERQLEAQQRIIDALLVRRAVAARELEIANEVPDPSSATDELSAQISAEERAKALLVERAEHQADVLRANRERLGELSEIFRETLQRLDLPWFGGKAEIDADTYLPMVDDQSLDELSSGGMKATVNLAYYLSNLVFALREPDAVMPRFLMIDGLRKDFGSGREDLARAEHIYEFFEIRQRMMSGPPARPFQLLIVDNDLPASQGNFNVLQLDYESPLIPLRVGDDQ